MCHLHIFNVGLKGSEDFIEVHTGKLVDQVRIEEQQFLIFTVGLLSACLVVIYSHVFGDLGERRTTEQFKLPLCPERKAPCRNLEFPSYTRNINN